MIINKILERIKWHLFLNYGIPKNIEERISKHYIKKFLPKNPVMIDCGAHDGGDSVELVKVIGGTLHAFEPVDDLHVRLRNNVKAYSEIQCYKLALSNQNGTSKFYVSEGTSDASSSLLQPKEHLEDHPSVHFNKTIEVKTITLDDWAAQNNISHVDLLWLDMQGFEMEMLLASAKILDTVKVIHTEVSVKDTYEGVAQYPKFRDWLISKGFSIQLECIPNGWDMGNVLFVRN